MQKTSEFSKETKLFLTKFQTSSARTEEQTPKNNWQYEVKN